jgi:putative transposase
MVSPQVKRQAIDVLRAESGLGVTRACGLVGISLSLYAYRSRRPDSLRVRGRIYVLLRREGWSINRKRTYRLYGEADLAVRRRERKRIGSFERKPHRARRLSIEVGPWILFWMDSATVASCAA